ncbi:hypothetical protein GA0061098_101664 [Bradyrhizobium shewense]|uniref:Uncharacterized protein n=1 Tax=Bradyrhizobium shewense TaxID=1761772 RepID=A0A1C3XHQ4_9BRAD|nr:hypothetical protein GA0061098_101664 [Bradyrhizobium shewense]
MATLPILDWKDAGITGEPKKFNAGCLEIGICRFPILRYKYRALSSCNPAEG